MEAHFKTKIGRPELLNRIGDNIVVFDFNSAEVAEQLVPVFARNVVRRVHDELEVDMQIADEVTQTLTQGAMAHLEFGGRECVTPSRPCPQTRWRELYFRRQSDSPSAKLLALVKVHDGWTATLK